MKKHDEAVFIVRMWRERGEQSGDREWRGSIRQVDTDSHIYVTGVRDVGDFISARLAAPHDTPGR